MVLVPIALDGQAPSVCSLDHKVDAVPHGADLGGDPVAALQQAPQHLPLEVGLAHRLKVTRRRGRTGHRVTEMADHPRLQVLGLELLLANRADEHETVAGA